MTSTKNQQYKTFELRGLPENQKFWKCFSNRYVSPGIVQGKVHRTQASLETYQKQVRSDQEETRKGKILAWEVRS
jgi:hypothetical protein